MKRKYLYFLLGLGFSALLNAQQTDDLAPVYRNSLTLTIGLEQGYFRDRNYSPLNYRSGGKQFGLSYGRTTSRGHRWTGSLNFGLGTLRHPSEYERHPRADRYKIDLSVGYLRRVGRAGENRSSWAGIQYRSYVDLTLYDDAESVTFYALHGFEAATATDWKTGDRHRLLAEISVPVFGLLSRPPYTGWDKFIVDNAENIPKIVTRGNWVTFGQFTAIRASAGWTYDLGEHWSATAHYRLAYYATKQLDPVRILDNSFSLSSTLKF